jgi:hypothetical protein
VNERNEIMGDWYEAMGLELERLDAWENAPEPKPLTDEELEDWHARTEGTKGTSTTED